MSRRARRILAGSLLLVAVAFLATSSPKLRWRTRLVALKVQGRVPFLGWKELVHRLGPASTGNWQMAEIEWRLQWPITEKERGEAPCPVLWQTPEGPFWGRSTDANSLAQLMQEQLGESIYQREPVVIRSGDVVLDVGSHLGTFSRFALNHGARLVVAFDPDPTTNICFKRTFQKEIAEKRVLLVEAAAWSVAGTLSFKENPAYSVVGTVLTKAAGLGVVTVAATTIDETVRRLNLAAVDFIKMDIEGAEREALRGGRETLGRFGPRMALCIYHRPDDPAVIRQVVLEARPAYRMFATLQQAYYY